MTWKILWIMHDMPTIYTYITYYYEKYCHTLTLYNIIRINCNESFLICPSRWRWPLAWPRLVIDCHNIIEFNNTTYIITRYNNNIIMPYKRVLTHIQRQHVCRVYTCVVLLPRCIIYPNGVVQGVSKKTFNFENPIEF